MKRKQRTYLGLATTDKRIIVTLRIFGYGVMMAAAGVIAAVLVATASGYDINRETGEVIQNGLILVDTKHVSADVFVDGVDEQDSTPARLPLPAGTHQVRMSLDGYHGWTKLITLVGSDVEWLYYPRLFPKDLKTVIIESFKKANQGLQSPNERWVLLHPDEAINSFLLLDLDNPLDQLGVVKIPAKMLMKAKTDDKQTFTILEWSESNRHALVLHVVAGKKEIISVDINTPAKSVNITSLSGLKLDIAHYKSGSDDKFFILASDSVRELSIDSKQVSTPVLEDVSQFSLAEDDRLLYVQKAEATSQNEIGIWSDGNKTVVSSVALSAKQFDLSLSKYDDDLYFSIVANKSDKMLVYKNAESESSNIKSPFITIEFGREILSSLFSPTDQFIVVAGVDKLMTYDIETAKVYEFTAKGVTGQAEDMNWLDTHRIVSRSSAGELSTFEFDGENSVPLGHVAAGFMPYFDSSVENMYTIDLALNKKTFVINQSKLILE